MGVTHHPTSLALHEKYPTKSKLSPFPVPHLQLLLRDLESFSKTPQKGVCFTFALMEVDDEAKEVENR